MERENPSVIEPFDLGFEPQGADAGSPRGSRAESASHPSSGTAEILGRIRAMLVEHLGGEAAADAWLRSTDTGYPGSALDAVESGRGDLVLADLEDRWGPSPSYA